LRDCSSALPSRRLTGDYLAIVTLFFLQLFQTLTTNGDSAFGHNLTGGPNGMLNVDPFSLFGHDLAVQHQGVFAVSYFYVALGFFAVVFVALRFVNQSRTGRALALPARGPAGGRGDGHARQLAEAAELLLLLGRARPSPARCSPGCRRASSRSPSTSCC